MPLRIFPTAKNSTSVFRVPLGIVHKVLSGIGIVSCQHLTLAFLYCMFYIMLLSSYMYLQSPDTNAVILKSSLLYKHYVDLAI